MVVEVNMKMLAGMWLSLLLIPCGHGFAQIVRTNKVGPEEAIKIVSQLTLGMRHEDVVKSLDRSGLKSEGAGPSFHNTNFRTYTLTDGCFLSLGYVPPVRGTNKYDYIAELANSRINEASIYGSNGLLMTNITLRKAP
jgi:hypothetical protein